MKLRKLAAVLTAAAVAVTSSIVCPLTVNAVELTGSGDTGEWANNISITGADAITTSPDSAQLVIDYSSTDQTAWGSQYKLASQFGDYTVIDAGSNLNITGGSDLVLNVKDFSLTPEHLEYIAENGFMIQGYNLTVNSVSLRWLLADEKIASDSTSTTVNDWSDPAVHFAADDINAVLDKITNIDNAFIRLNYKAANPNPNPEAGQYEYVQFKLVSGAEMNIVLKDSVGGIVDTENTKTVDLPANILNDMDTAGLYIQGHNFVLENIEIYEISDTAPASKYAVQVAEDIENGTVEADKTEAAEGETVTVTVTPNEGFKLDKLTVVQGETPVTTTDGETEGQYTFDMPAGDVTITATFAADDQPTDDAIWAGNHDVGTEWGNALTIAADRFSDVEEGDTLKFTFTLNADAEYHQIQINDGNWKPLSSCADDLNEYNSIDVNGTTYEMVINAADLALVKAIGMVLNGFNVTYTKVELVKDTGDDDFEPHGDTDIDTSEAAEEVPDPTMGDDDLDPTINNDNIDDVANEKTVAQKSEPDPANNTCSYRFFMLINEEDVTNHGAVRIRISVTDSAGKESSSVFKTTNYYTSIAIGGETIEPPEGKVFVAFALKNIPTDATVNYSEIKLGKE